MHTVVFVYEISEEERDRKREHSAGVLDRLVPKDFEWERDFKQLHADHVRNDEAGDKDTAMFNGRQRLQMVRLTITWKASALLEKDSVECGRKELLTLGFVRGLTLSAIHKRFVADLANKEEWSVQ